MVVRIVKVMEVVDGDGGGVGGDEEMHLLKFRLEEYRRW